MLAACPEHLVEGELTQGWLVRLRLAANGRRQPLPLREGAGGVEAGSRNGLCLQGSRVTERPAAVYSGSSVTESVAS